MGGGWLVVVAGGGEDDQRRTALQWVRGAQSWAPLPDLAEKRCGAAAVALPDGRAMVVGGWLGGNERALASVEVLAADGSGWSALAPMGTGRNCHVAAVLPCGKVLVAGGMTTLQPDSTLKTAELWDPATGAWSELPPMAQERWCAACCVLPSGRVAVVGGQGSLPGKFGPRPATTVRCLTRRPGRGARCRPWGTRANR